MEFECEALWGWMTELAWKYLRPQAPREINVPTKIRRVLVGLIDKKVCHPGILNQCRNSVEELLSQKDFFDRFLYDRLESTLPESAFETPQATDTCKSAINFSFEKEDEYIAYFKNGIANHGFGHAIASNR